MNKTTTVKINNYGDVHLVMFSTRDEMLTGIKADAEKEYWPGITDIDGGTMALCHPVTRITISNDGTETRNPDIARVYLNSEDFSWDIVAHESFHVACAYVRNKSGLIDELNLGIECGDIEEELAYAHTDIFNAIAADIESWNKPEEPS